MSGINKHICSNMGFTAHENGRIVNGIVNGTVLLTTFLPGGALTFCQRAEKPGMEFRFPSPMY